MPRVGILCNKKGWYFQKLRAEFAARDIEVEQYTISDLAIRLNSGEVLAGLGKPWKECDALLVRGIPGGSLEQIIMRMDSLHCLEEQGVYVINSPGAIEKTVDKLYTTFLLAKAGVRVPATVVTESYDEAMEAFYVLGGDVVVKPLFGSCGKGMVRVEGPDLAHRIFVALKSGNYVYYLQEYISCNNRDVRAFVLGDDILAAMLRQNTVWKANYACGAKLSAWQLDQEAREIVLKSAKVAGTEYAGIDLLYSETGEIYVTEINGIPGWEGLQQVCSLNIAAEIVNYIIRALKLKLSSA